MNGFACATVHCLCKLSIPDTLDGNGMLKAFERGFLW